MIGRWLAIGLGMVCVGLALASGYVWSTRPKTYNDAVREVLDQRQIGYTGLEVREICLPDPHCVITGDGTRTFSTIVLATLQVHGSTAGSGLIVCYDRRGDCYFDLPSLNIWRAPLRDLRGVRWLPKQVVQGIVQIVWWLRAAGQHDQSLFFSELSSG